MIVAICILGGLLLLSIFVIGALWYALGKLMNEYIEQNPKEMMKYYFKHWTNLSGTGVSFPSRDSKICIDYILLMKNKAKVNVLDAKVCRKFETGDPQMASDHLPVYVELELL